MTDKTAPESVPPAAHTWRPERFMVIVAHPDDADFGPADVKVAQIYDAFSPLIPLSLEGYGFCQRGEGAEFTSDGRLEWPNGALPVNTSGGGMSEAYVHGFNLISEGVRQMRGTSTSQVDGADTCLVTSGEGVPTSALLLRRP